jgi:hypothetical protein
MKTATLRKELHTYIDALPEHNLRALKPLLSILAEKSCTIETNLTNEENSLIAERMGEYKKHPEDFVSLDSIQ